MPKPERRVSRFAASKCHFRSPWLMAANPQLAEHGPSLPAGLQIWLPDLQPAATGAVRLWD